MDEQNDLSPHQHTEKSDENDQEHEAHQEWKLWSAVMQGITEEEGLGEWPNIEDGEDDLTPEEAFQQTYRVYGERLKEQGPRFLTTLDQHQSLFKDAVGKAHNQLVRIGAEGLDAEQDHVGRIKLAQLYYTKRWQALTWLKRSYMATFEVRALTEQDLAEVQKTASKAHEATKILGSALKDHYLQHDCYPPSDPSIEPFHGSKSNFKEWGAKKLGVSPSTVYNYLMGTGCYETSQPGSNYGLEKTLERTVAYAEEHL